MVNLNMYALVALIVFLYSTAFSNPMGLGRCPKLDYMPNFNITQFVGRWYEIERSFHLIQFVSNCIIVDLSENRKGRLAVDVTTTSRWTGDMKVSEGVAVSTRRDPSLLRYKVVSDLPRVVSQYLPGAGFYQIIDTDYRNYAVLWSCTSYGVVYNDFIWIWGRTNEINAGLRDRIYKVLERKRLDSERLILSRTANCTEF